MLLKRVFDHSGTEPVLDHVKVLRASDKQHFSTRFVEKQIADGLMSMGQGKITLHTKPELKYTIVRPPGLYCAHCNASLADASMAKQHVESAHKGKPSPDESNPAGYRRDNFYTAVKEDSNG